MRSLLIYLKDYKKESILGPLFKMLEASFELLVPLVMAAIINVGIADDDNSYIAKMCIIMVVLGIIGLICSITAQFYAAKAAVGFGTKLRHALFSHIQNLSFTELDSIGTSTMITRMISDINQVQTGVNLVLRLFLRSPFVVFGAMIMAFMVDVKAAIVFVVIIPLLSIVVFGIMLISMPMYKKVQVRLDKVLEITRENLTGARVIRAFQKEDEEIIRFKDSNSMLAKMQMFVGKISALMNPVTYVIINGGIIALIWSGALHVDNGTLKQGDVIALVNYMSQILVELIKLANLIITVTKALACANRVQGVFEIIPSMDKNQIGKNLTEAMSDNKEDIIIAFEHVSLTYKNAGDEALTDINFKVKRGQTIGIIGGTGSGKSSLVHLIPRFYDASRGKVWYNGTDIKECPVKYLRDQIGIVMQKAILFQGTIRENLRWGKKNATDEEMNHALLVAQAKDFVDAKEGGLNYLIDQGGKNLSGGQKQRLTIARAIVKKPEILILDDSASALDYATDAALRGAIKNMQGRLTTFIVSQRASSVLHADQIIVLDDGAISGIGTHEELLEHCPVYQEIYQSGSQSNAK